MVFRFILTVSTLLVGPSVLGETPAEEAPPKPLKFVQLHCPPSDTKVLLSTLTLAQRLHEQGNDVVIFIDLDAAVIGERSLRHVPSDRREDVRKLLDQLTDAGVKLLVCPHCAKRFDLRSASLRRGASMTNQTQLKDLKERADQIFEYREPPTKIPNDVEPQV